MGRLLKLLSFLTILNGCYSDFSLSPITTIPPVPEDVPNITVNPTIINFGALNADGETDSETITVGNNGSETLYIDDIQLSIASNVFTISPISGEDILEPSEEVTFTVTYDPETHEDNNNAVQIFSNDPDDYEAYVWIDGSGDAPVISIEPEEYAFGNILVGCEEVLEIAVSNTGNVDLIIDRVDYYITYPADLGIYNFEDTYGPLPWVLAPGESIVLEIFYYPTDVDLDYGTVEIYSNDPLTPIADADQEAEGVYESVYEETFEQDEIDSVDILFVVDNSCSMSGQQTQLANNFDTFMNVFQASGIDYNIGFITTDSDDIVGDLITIATVDPATEVSQIIDSIGTHGSSNERGIYFAYEALQTGGDFGPGSTFWRNDAKLIVIFVSDEDDHSSTTPTTFKVYTVAVKGGADYVTAHAVAGDYPGGCTANGGASEGYEYYTVVSYLNGTFLSICADDWGTPLETLANDSILKSSFTLTKEAVEDTIYVEIDGVESSEWTYDSATNAISFNEGYTPTAGANIYVSYNPISDCPI
jgi:hypothetical protein